MLWNAVLDQILVEEIGMATEIANEACSLGTDGM